MPGEDGDADPSLHDAPTLDLSVVVPYFNTGDRVRATVDRLVAALNASGRSFEVICVSDGSTDGSDASLDTCDPHVVRRVCLPENRGKGEALRAGFQLGRGRWIGFIDGDGDLPPEQMSDLAAVAFDPASPRDVVLGSKLHPGSEVVYTPLRRLASWGWQQAVAVAFSLRVRDTQCGVKLFERQVLAEVLPLTRERRFAFDVELLVVARHLGHRAFVEVPVRIEARRGSTVSLHAAAAMLADLAAIWWRLRIRHDYDRARRP